MNAPEIALAILRAHAGHLGASSVSWNAECLSDNCSWHAHGTEGGMFAAHNAHQAHLAQVLAEWVAKREARAWDAALKHASRLGVPTPPNPYRKDQEADRG